MAPRLKLALWLSALLLSGCAEISQLGQGDVFQMHRTAVLAYESGEDARAEALYQGLARVAPNDPETWLRLGNLYARSNRPDDAAEAYQRSLMLNPNDSRLWYNLGIIRQRQAHAAFIQTQQLTPDDDPLHIKSATLIKQVAPLNVAPAANKDENNAGK
ncbi:MAG TPA: tetratricopeptide repeat protein [Rhodocyclaceae bacterium]|nr:tetratricopeptide repeat protein [Rhodocyclaceae bacterium]